MGPSDLPSTNVFDGRPGGNRAPSPPPSKPQRGPNVSGGKPTGPAVDDNNGITSYGTEVNTLAGGTFIPSDTRKFKYDESAGMKKVHAIGLSRDDRMSAEEAGIMLELIHARCGVSGENETTLSAFDRALWVCHTVNSGSTQNPGRCIFEVPGITNPMDYSLVVNILGPDLRRFFRAYADDITRANRRALRGYDPKNLAACEIWGWINQVACERGLQRHPHLAHDSADACVFLTMSERAALDAAKHHYLAGRENTADASLNERYGK